MRLLEGIQLDFNDVLIVPQRSSLDSRSQVQLTREYKFIHSKRTWTGIGIIASNMDAVGSFKMAKELAKFKMLTALHKYYPENELIEFFSDPELANHTFYTVGMNKEDEQKLENVASKLPPGFPYFLCIDVPNGYTQKFIEVVKAYRKKYPDTVILAGNVCTPNVVEELILSGADIVKVGIGGGGQCLTRIKTGVGFPQLSAVDACSFVAHGKPKGHICSDGGCVDAGDICKAFCAGSDFVMVGSMLAGSSECDGEWEEGYNIAINPETNVPAVSQKTFKKRLKFFGMSSSYAQKKFNHGLKDYRTSEGRCIYIPYKGLTSDVVQDIFGGLRSCGTYIGAKKVKDFPKCACFIRVNSTHNKSFSQFDKDKETSQLFDTSNSA